MSTKYGGYRPYSVRESTLTWAPHVPSRAHQDAIHHVARASYAVPDATASSAPLAAAASATLTKDAFVVERAAAGITMLPMEKSMPKRSCSSAAFPDFAEEARSLRAKDAAAVGAAFDAVDAGGDGVLLASEARMFLHELLGVEPTARQLRALQAQFARAPGGKLARDDAPAALGAVADALDAELHALRPSATASSIVIASRYRELQDAARRSGTLGVTGSASTTSLTAAAGGAGFHMRGPAPHSSYQTDMGGDAASGPASRPVADAVSAGAFSTTCDLSAGTTRQSKHAPGYMGHIPSFTGTHAAAQGLGQTKRDTFHAKTNLADTFVRRVPGYSGHVPRFTAAASADVRMPVGQFAPTETTAAAHVVLTHWKATGAASKK